MTIAGHGDHDGLAMTAVVHPVAEPIQIGRSCARMNNGWILFYTSSMAIVVATEEAVASLLYILEEYHS